MRERACKSTYTFATKAPSRITITPHKLSLSSKFLLPQIDYEKILIVIHINEEILFLGVVPRHIRDTLHDSALLLASFAFTRLLYSTSIPD